GLHYPSMYQDLIKNHRLTEIDYINGAVWRKGQKYDIATPYCADVDSWSSWSRKSHIIR
ncbi:ketopantoate reductase C-terminal domain-containing protein, partial [Enterococcus faecium]|uniref:ketopantoate reductase C-terminal domain-containing protein n=1 Tax=Enterococcus faecium TaxID=1352 RepID=UPI002AAAC52D